MKAIVITGASTGIGYALVKVFLQQDYHVFGSVRKKVDADRLSDEFGEHFMPLQFDVTDEKAIEGAVEIVKGKLGDNGLNGLINNAGIAVNGPIQDLTMEEFRLQFDVNFFGLVAVTKAFLPLLGAVENYPQTPGTVINISSVAGKLSFPFLGPYTASKHAVEAFSQSLRREMLIFGVKVVIVGPGAIKTPIWEKVGEPLKNLGNSPYKKAVGNVLAEFGRQEMKAMEADELARRIYKIFENPRPRTRYSILNDRVTDYWLPRFVFSDKTLDGFIGKLMKK